MNEHSRIVEEIARQYDLWSDAIIVSPSALAHSVYVAIASGTESDTINYLSLEQLKQMSRQFLRKRKDDDGDENETYSAQAGFDFGSEFSGKLQDRYPVQRGQGEEPIYKLRHHLTPEEREWNVRQLRKSSEARQRHADALEAEGLERQAA